MIGMNAFFHLSAALLTLGLVYGLLTVLRQRDFLQELFGSFVRSRHGQRTRVYVDSPRHFLKRFAKALQISMDEGDGADLSPRRLAPGALLELYLTHGLFAIKWTSAVPPRGGRLEIEFAVYSPPSPILQAALAEALGDDMSVTYRVMNSQRL